MEKERKSFHRRIIGPMIKVLLVVLFCTLKLLLKPEMSQNRAQASKNAKPHTLEVSI